MRTPTDAVAQQARFLAVISHELRTPLTTIASFTESLDTDDLAPAERSVALTAVRRNTGRMLALVGDLMVVSRLQTGDLELRPERVDLAATIRAAAALLASREPFTATAVETPDGPPLTADPALLRDLFYAVIGTVASGAADRSATVRAEPGPGAWTVTVSAPTAEPLTDEALMAGMLADPEPPHRRRSTALWLLLAEAIADRHGGSVVPEHARGAGAKARIHLPLAIPTASHAGEPVPVEKPN